jgi:hypothetical protein
MDDNLTPFTAEEQVRLELLAYPDPEGLHPIEASWRRLARKLKNKLQHADSIITQHHDSRYWKCFSTECPVCKDKYTQNVFPKPFEPKC